VRLRPGRVLAPVAAGVLVIVGLVPTIVAVAAGGWLPTVGYLVFQVTLTLAGLLLWPDRDSRKNALLLLSAGFLVGVSNLSNPLWDNSETFATQIGWTFRWASVPVLAAVLIAYPGARVERRSSRALVALIGVWAVAVPVVSSLLWDPQAAGYTGPERWWTAHPANGFSQAVTDQSFWLLAILIVWWVGEMARRWRSARGPTRWPVRQVVVAGVVLGVGLLAREGAARAAGAGWVPAEVERWVAGLHAAGGTASALVLVVAAIRAATRRAVVVEQLLAAGNDPQAVQNVLRRSLADPTLALRFALAAGWVGVGGEPVDDREERDRMRRVLLREQGVPVVEVDADAEVESAPAALRVTLAAATVVLANTRLNVERAAHLVEVKASRTRIVEAGVAQRRALERDLHDGAQQTLLAVAATLSRASVAQGTEGMRAAVGDAQAQLADALSEVRRLARGVHPAALSQGGLGAGLQSLAAGSHRVRLQLDTGVANGLRFPGSVETTAYYVVAEAVSNALKHAGDAAVLVSVGVDATAVEVKVTDDGPGGAHVESGGGLAGLQDRVRALGGTFNILSPMSAGTQICAVLPLTGVSA